MKFSIFFASLAVMGLSPFAQAQDYHAYGGNFEAPTVNGVNNVSNPVTGEIVYDTSVPGFYGRLSSTWQALGGTAATVVTAPPTVQTFTSSSGTYDKDYTFVITSGNATVGATYTNNSVTFTVYATVSGATQVVMSGSGAPNSSGTLTKTGGTGDSTLTFSQVLAPLYIRVRMVGGGGGGAGSGTAGTMGGGSNGTASTFGSSLLSAGGGVAAGTNGSGGSGGTSSLGSGPTGLATVGGAGTAAVYQSGTSVQSAGGTGGSSLMGGGASAPAPSGTTGIAGNNATANTGGGGSGAAQGNPTLTYAGGGGGAGGYVDAIINNPSNTYSYAIGSGGSGGGAGTSGTAGGTGGSGIIIVEEHYQ